MSYDKIGHCNGHGVDQPAQRFGVEVELEGVSSYPECATPTWSYKPDGSLRDGGMEFITPPNTYEDTVKAIEFLYRLKSENGWRGSSRCGTHVHVEMNSRTWDEVHALVVAYALSEPLIYNMCGAARDENIYCIPWYRSDVECGRIRTAMATGDSYALHVLRDTNKYSGLYLEPLDRFGTVEFRMPPVFRTSDGLCAFLRVVDSLAAYCIGRTARRVMTDYYNVGAQCLMYEIYGDVLPNMYEGDCQELLDKYDVESICDALAGLPPQLTDWVAPAAVEATGTNGYYARAEDNYNEEEEY